MEIQIVGDDMEAIKKMSSLVERTNKANPKPQDMKELRATLDVLPDFCRDVGNVQGTIFKGILERLAGESAFGRECLERYVGEMKTELGYHTSTFVEKMLIDEVVMRWLRLQAMENDHRSVTYREHRFSEGLYHDKRLHMSQARYLKAMETLVKVRKMISVTQAKGAEMFKNLLLRDEKEGADERI